LPDGAVGSPPPLFVTVGNTSRDERGVGYSEHFGPRRRKTFSPGSKVKPGLKARTKASLSTSDGIIHIILRHTMPKSHK
jgi:hypothetical protein